MIIKLFYPIDIGGSGRIVKGLPYCFSSYNDYEGLRKELLGNLYLHIETSTGRLKTGN